MGKWSGLKGQVPLAPVDLEYQQKVNFVKNQPRGVDEQPEPSFQELSVADRAREFCKIRDRKDELEAEISDLNVSLEALSQLMITELESDGTNMFRLSSGDSLSIKDDAYCSVEDKNKFIDWIKQSGQEDLLSVHYMTLSSMTKNRLEQGQPAPPGIKVFLKQSITRRKARG